MDVAIIWRPVRSTNVASIGWPQFDRQAVLTENPLECNLLLVRFMDGRCYGYLGVTRQRAVYMATRCRSVGRYINLVIKPHFQAVRIPELDTTEAPF